MQEEAWLTGSEKPDTWGYYRWYVVGRGGHVLYRHNRSGGVSLKACLSWLKNNGFVPDSNTYPEMNRFIKTVTV